MRLVLENVLLFLLPAALYFAWQLMRTEAGTPQRTEVLQKPPLVALFVAGVMLVGATRIYYATTSPGGAPSLSYTPPRMGKDGTIEPGQLK